jgi:hypothetical protein
MGRNPAEASIFVFVFVLFRFVPESITVSLGDLDHICGHPFPYSSHDSKCYLRSLGLLVRVAGVQTGYSSLSFANPALLRTQ